VTLARGTARLESFHFTGPDMDMQARGAAALNGQSLDLNINANANLALAKRFDRDVISSGTVALAATVGGSVNKPLVNGKLSLHDASLNYAAFPNGISHANGVVQFNGNSAAVQNITGESGGGKINLDGFVAFRDELRFGLRARATGVRVLPQQGMSAVLDANLNLTGTVRASRVSGLVTVQQVTYAPQSDIGAILARSTPPVENAATPSPLLDNMKLDVQVRTAASIDVRASMAENLQLDANLRLRGSASQPGLLGRITITDGQLVFFNSTYTVNTGTISFFNPVRIEPVLNLSLNTQAKGVDVVLKVTGPIDNMKLSYTSNPPLQFQEIVGLLAAGQTPTSDPTILANQPPDPPQSFTQLGESAVVTQALADPVASRLQRVFGISQLSLNPVFSSGTDLPEARIALTQRISSNMTFTYVTALNAPNTQIIRAEWMLNERWAAMATRDQNGILSVRLTYRREIR
jgi:translocation and assembly module TamB